ncbi:hypothetical protein H310_13961 [Aphanomyces invadans]|uniref:Uncharacterized protein n=1 Tax=Aphanomyces invadans TaxID=157072 RepID=A0A024TDN5_9STRA|nr:hypothetical protein H310_13961 [Aphanomyces invadans]ETV91412.1 hypothetical protein H310_13961 [Aphanomyces invadans]|eukprot:XP_008879864.1 hypothetical protein H310_13961 [Aphanomyces invadans]
MRYVMYLHRVGELPVYFADKFFLHKPPKRSQSPECKSFASVDVAPDAAVVVSKLPDLLLSMTPEVLHFKQAPLASSPTADENNRPPLRPNDIVELASADLFLNNVSLVHHLVVYVIVSKSMQVLGKSLVAVPGDIQQRKGAQPPSFG